MPPPLELQLFFKEIVLPLVRETGKEIFLFIGRETDKGIVVLIVRETHSTHSVGMYMYHGMCLEVRRQLLEIGSVVLSPSPVGLGIT